MIKNIFEMNFARNCVKNMEFYFQSNCPMSKSLNHCHTELFTIYQNKHWTIRQWGDHSVDPSSHCIILKIVVFLVTCLVMSKP